MPILRASRLRASLARLAAAGVVLAVSTASLAVAPTANAAIPKAVPSTAAPAAKRWSPSWMTGKTSFTRDEAIAAATRFDVIAAQPPALAPYVADMHAANPSLKVLAYVNGTFAKTTTYPESYYAHDGSAQRISWIPFATWEFELSNPGARGVVAATARAALATAPFDGILLDNMGLTVLNIFDKSGAPIDPATSVTYTGTDWLSQTTALINEFHAAFPQALVISNGLAWGKIYNQAIAPTSVLAQPGTSGEAEQFVRSAKQPVTTYRREADWKLDVDMLIDSEQRGAPVTVVTKLWLTATKAQRDSWHRYALATFLLGNDGTSWFVFLGDQNVSTTTAGSAAEQTRIGTAAGTYSKTDGAYQRAFTNGLVLVNPTTKAVTVPITRSYTNLDGAVVSGTVSLAPYTAQILKNG